MKRPESEVRGGPGSGGPEAAGEVPGGARGGAGKPREAPERSREASGELPGRSREASRGRLGALGEPTAQKVEPIYFQGVILGGVWQAGIIVFHLEYV